MKQKRDGISPQRLARPAPANNKSQQSHPDSISKMLFLDIFFSLKPIQKFQQNSTVQSLEMQGELQRKFSLKSATRHNLYCPNLNSRLVCLCWRTYANEETYLLINLGKFSMWKQYEQVCVRVTQSRCTSVNISFEVMSSRVHMFAFLYT